MKEFFAIVVKDLRVRFASPMSLVFFLVLPLVFTAILAGTGGSTAGSEGRTPLVLVRDRDGGPAGRSLVALLGRMPEVRVREVSDPAEILRSSEPDLLVSIEPSTAPGSVPHVKLLPSPWKSSAETVRAVGEWLASQGAPRSASPAQPADRSAPADRPAPVEGSAPNDRPAPREAAATVTAPSSAATGNAGQIITWVLVPLLGLGAGTIAERRRGTLRRALVAPIPRATVTLAPAAAEILAALVQVGLLAGFGAAAFGLPWMSHPLELASLSVAFCFAAAALGALLGSVCRTERQAGSLGLAIAMVLAVLGGCWYPSAFFPAGLRSVTRLDPAGWAMDGFLAVLSRGSAAAAWRPVALLAGFGACALVIVALVGRLRRGDRA